MVFQHERARVIYKYALDHLPKEACQEVYKCYTRHEKKFGDRAGIEDVIVSKRKFQYEEVKFNSSVYDCGNSSANALQLPQSCTKPLNCEQYVDSNRWLWCLCELTHWPLGPKSQTNLIMAIPN